MHCFHAITRTADFRISWKVNKTPIKRKDIFLRAIAQFNSDKFLIVFKAREQFTKGVDNVYQSAEQIHVGFMSDTNTEGRQRNQEGDADSFFDSLLEATQRQEGAIALEAVNMTYNSTIRVLDAINTGANATFIIFPMHPKNAEQEAPMKEEEEGDQHSPTRSHMHTRDIVLVEGIGRSGNEKDSARIRCLQTYHSGKTLQC